mgnify:CR=1 FL=1
MPQRIIGVDYETYYDDECSITIQGSYNYCRHPKYDAYMVTIATCGGDEFVGHPKDFDWASICQPGDIWVSHNQSFDRTVYEADIQKGITPDVFPDEWYCTADLAAFLGYPRSLANAGKFLLGKEIDKSTRNKMKGKRWENMTPEFQKEVTDYAMGDALDCRDLFLKYGHLWPQTERDYSNHTILMGNRGVPINEKKLNDGIKLLGEKIWQAEQDIPWDWDKDKTPLSPKSLAKQCRTVSIDPPKSLAQDSLECAAWEDKYGSKFPWVGAMRDWRRCNMLLKKLTAMKNRIKTDKPGWMAYGQLYGGAHTLRDSGSGGVNMQNMPRTEMFGVNMRNLIEAPKGFKFISADYGQIEARVTAWLSGDEALLKQVRAGIDIYEAHARATMGYTNPKPLKDVDPDLRQLAKARVLSLGFGCGAAKFVVMAKTMYGIDIKLADAKTIVSEYRRVTPVKKTLWQVLERGIWDAVGSWRMQLPSGRYLNYRNIKKRGDEYNQVLTAAIPRGANFINVKFWGGKLTENLVQATARDLFVEGVLRVEKAGYPVLMRIHDEVLCMVPEAEADAACREVERLLCIPPEWAPDLPVSADASIIDRYTK